MKLRRRCLMASASQADLLRLGEDEAERLDGAVHHRGAFTQWRRTGGNPGYAHEG